MSNGIFFSSSICLMDLTKISFSVAVNSTSMVLSLSQVTPFSLSRMFNPSISSGVNSTFFMIPLTVIISIIIPSFGCIACIYTLSFIVSVVFMFILLLLDTNCFRQKYMYGCDCLCLQMMNLRYYNDISIHYRSPHG